MYSPSPRISAAYKPSAESRGNSSADPPIALQHEGHRWRGISEIHRCSGPRSLKVASEGNEGRRRGGWRGMWCKTRLEGAAAAAAAAAEAEASQHVMQLLADPQLLSSLLPPLSLEPKKSLPKKPCLDARLHPGPRCLVRALADASSRSAFAWRNGAGNHHSPLQLVPLLSPHLCSGLEYSKTPCPFFSPCRPSSSATAAAPPSWCCGGRPRLG